MKQMLRQHQNLLITAAVLIVYLALFFVIPMKCPILWLTGFSCPGCGITRALVSLCRLDFAAAWHYNPVIFYLVPAAPFFLIAELRRANKLKEAILWITVGLLIAVYLYRLLISHSPVVQADFSQGFLAKLW